jgi:hypothetical protein
VVCVIGFRTGGQTVVGRTGESTSSSFQENAKSKKIKK